MCSHYIIFVNISSSQNGTTKFVCDCSIQSHMCDVDLPKE